MKRYKTNVKNHGFRTLFAACAAIAAAGVSLPASAECIAHWDFGSDALGEVDKTGNYNLVNSNGVTVVNGMAVIDNSTAPVKGYVTRSSIQFDQGTAYTIECWVKTGTADPNNIGMILELSDNFFTHSGCFMLNAVDGATIKTTDGHRQRKFNAGVSIADNKWHHLAIIVNPAGASDADQFKFYVDKVLQNESSAGSGTGIKLKSDVLYIGSRGCAGYPFTGQISDVRITEGVLSTDDFCVRSDNSIFVRAYWKFDDGNPLVDSSGNGNTLQGSQGVTFANGCASFNGTASNVKTVNTLDLSAYKDVTVECFVRKHANADVEGMILEHSNYFINPQEFMLSLNSKGAGSVSGSCRFNDGNILRDYYSPVNTVNAGWHHVALVKDSSKAGTDQSLRLYVDGIQQTTGEYKSTASGENLRNDILYIGSRNNSGIFLNADVDDVRISAQVLQPEYFLMTRTGPIEDVIAYWPFEKTENMMEDATGNGNVLTGTGVTVENGAAVFNGSQNGFATLSTLPLYPYESMTVEWYMKSSTTELSIVLETSPNFNYTSGGTFMAILNDKPTSLSAGYRLRGYNLSNSENACDGRWHHYALVYDSDNTTVDIVRLYRDRVQVTTRTNNDTTWKDLRADRLYIGARGGSANKFVGELDDIKITGRALAPAEFMTKRSKPPTGMTLIFR